LVPPPLVPGLTLYSVLMMLLLYCSYFVLPESRLQSFFPLASDISLPMLHSPMVVLFSGLLYLYFSPKTVYLVVLMSESLLERHYFGPIYFQSLLYFYTFFTCPFL
jgi:hypothetical protein